MSLDKIEIQTEYEDLASKINTEGLTQVFETLALTKPVIYYFLSDEELLQVNISMLQHDYYTDIITFDYTDDHDIEQNEILISWDRVRDNAKTHGQSIHQELHRVCIHGLLHLAGYNDQTEQEKQKMRSLETHYLNLHCST
jgi:probable rRNA maturation factor